MTISYNQDVINAYTLTFLQVIFRWKGSLWKSVFIEVWLWTLCYYLVLIIYRQYLDKPQQLLFEHIAKYTDGKMDYIPLIFMLGFYVAFVVDRWKQIFANIGFIDSTALWVATFIKGYDQEARTIRRNLIRYLCLTQILVLRDTSTQVRKRFPNIESLVDANLLQPNERILMDSVRNDFPRYWMPIHWIFTIGQNLMESGRITHGMMDAILQETKAYRERLQLLLNYDWVPVPLAYSQVVFWATRTYFLLCLFTRQFRIWEQHDSPIYVEYYFPMMTVIQLICFMGWLKVAEALLNPLGADDDDFECNYIIDRNLSVGMTMVDECYGQMPNLRADNIGTEGEKAMYSKESINDPQHPLIGSAELAAAKNVGIDEKSSVKMVEKDTLTTASSQARKISKARVLRALQRTFRSKNRSKDGGIGFDNLADIVEEADEENAQQQQKEQKLKSNSVFGFPFNSSTNEPNVNLKAKISHDKGAAAPVMSAPAALDKMEGNGTAEFY